MMVEQNMNFYLPRNSVESWLKEVISDNVPNEIKDVIYMKASRIFYAKSSSSKLNYENYAIYWSFNSNINGTVNCAFVIYRKNFDDDEIFGDTSFINYFNELCQKIKKC